MNSDSPSTEPVITGSDDSAGHVADGDAMTPGHPQTAGAAAARSAAGTTGSDRPAPEIMRGLRATASAPDQISILSPEGELTAHPDYPLDVTPELVRGLYRDMVLVRRFDREGNALQRQGQLGLWVPLLGQEAAQIGSGRAMRPRDMAFPSYREHGVAWTRGVDPVDILGMFRGIDHGSWNPAEKRFGQYTIVIGNQAPIAVGYAMGQRLDGAIGDDENAEASIVYFGDGATSEGDIHEGMVFGAAFSAPVVFFCQNNQWAISAPLETQTRVPLYRRANAYGFPGLRVDGNDVLAVLAVTKWALDECRTGNGPVMIEAFTYRMDAHTTSDDPTRYRLADETESWRLLDPIERVKAYLARNGLADAAYFDEIQVEADELAARFRAHCVGLQPPTSERMFNKVYSDPSPQVTAQQAEHEEYQAGFADTEAVSR